MARKSDEHCVWHTEPLDNYFNLILSDQLCMAWSYHWNDTKLTSHVKFVVIYPRSFYYNSSI